MWKRIRLLSSILFILLYVTTFCCDYKAKKDWEQACLVNTIDGYQEFVNKHPDDERAIAAQDSIDKYSIDSDGKIKTMIVYGGISAKGMSLRRVTLFSCERGEYSVKFTFPCKLVGFEEQLNYGTPLTIFNKTIYIHSNATYHVKGIIQKQAKSEKSSEDSGPGILAVNSIELLKEGTGEDGVTLGFAK